MLRALRAIKQLLACAFLAAAIPVLAQPLSAEPLFAKPEYVTIHMEIEVNKPAAEVWSKIGDYCDISEWFKMDCKITSGDGDMGTVRALAGDRILEILVAKTDLSYGYTQPVVEGQFYNLYHGFMEAKPISASKSKILYTLIYDISDKKTQEEKDKDMQRRRTIFETGLIKMKEIAEK